MKNRFKEHIDRNFNLKNKRILMTISGGIDSVVLSYLFFLLEYDIILAHCNFQLRANESNEDERFVKDFGQKLGIKTLIKRFDTSKFSAESKMNTQLAARKLRYDWFEEIATENQCDYIATAHHADDNIETFIINLSRGTGLSGLLGIPEKNGKIIRPLLIFSRDEITEFAKQHNLQWREDSSNETEKYVRNKIRHHILPVLKEIHPSFLENFQQTQHYLAQSDQFIDENIEKIKKECFKESEYQTTIEIKPIKEASDVNFLLHKLFYPYNFRNIRDLRKMLDAQSGKELFSPTHNLIKGRDELLLKKRPPKIPEFETPLEFTFQEHLFVEEKIISYSVSDMKSSITIGFLPKKRDIAHFFDLKLDENLENDDYLPEEIAFIDYDKLTFPISLRHKKEGDFFYPLGMNQKKKLSKFYIDEKYSLFDKEQQWLLCSGENIVWVIGKRLDNRFKVTEKTKKILIVRKF